MSSFICWREQEHVAPELVLDLRDALAGRGVHRKLVFCNREVIDEAPRGAQADERGGEPPDERDGQAHLRREEAHHDVDVDVLALRGRERSAEEREPEREARREAAEAAEERERRGTSAAS